MKCRRCQHENEAGGKFCEECAAPLAQTCAQCGRPISLTAKFCPDCSHPTGVAATPDPDGFNSPPLAGSRPFGDGILTSKSALEGERKQVTVLFADLTGSLELLADRDPEDARSILDPVLERMMEAVHRYEGTVNQVMGDGIMALFGAPLAHEDHAVRACYAALRMQDTVKRYAEDIQRTVGMRIQIRVGINSGEVVVRSIGSDLHMDYTAVGQTTHLAARMEHLARPGSTLLTPDTLTQAEGFVQVSPLGPMSVKGLAAPLDVYELLGASAARSRLQAAAARGLTRFVGRRPELEQLSQALHKARGGHGQVVAVVGQPGVGKSRLFYEFTHSLRAREWLILEAGSVSYGRATTYLPVIGLLKDYFKITEQDSHRDIRAKVTGRLLILDEALRPALPALLTLLDVPVDDPQWTNLDPTQRRQRTLDALKRVLLRQSQNQPTLVVFEDLQWCDSETQTLLDSLVDSLPVVQLLLLVNYRPEFTHAWGSKTYYAQLGLDALAAEAASELVEALLGPDPTVRPLEPLLAAQADGNPLFLEESVRTLVETRALVGERGAYRLTRPLHDIQVPATVQTILATRIDRLFVAEKTLLQSAAVIGKDVPFALLQGIAGLSELDLRRAIKHLQAGEFLYETQLFPDLEYTFKHALTHDVAYGSLLQDQRRALHARILELIEASAQAHPEEHIERLAHHAFHAEVWPKAAIYLRQAGLKAFSRSAHQEAVAFFEQALVALGHLMDSREHAELTLDIRFDLRHALQPLGDFKGLHTNLRLAETLAGVIGDQQRLGRVLAYLTDCLRLSGDHDGAIEVGQRALTIARGLSDLGAHIPINTYLGQLYYARAEYGMAAELFRRNVDVLVGPFVYERFGLLQIPSVHSRTCLAWCLEELGEFAEAIEKGTEALAIAKTAEHPLNVAVACAGLGSAYVRHGQLDRAIPVLEQGVDVCRTWNVPVWFPRVASDLGLAYAQSGRIADGVAVLEEAVARGSAMGLMAGHSRSVAALAEAYLLAERVDESYKWARHALDLACRRGERGHEAWTLLLLAEVARRSDDLQSAHESCRQGCALAEELQMRPLLARLHLCRGRLALRSNDLPLSDKELATASVLFSEMRMEQWRTEAERAREELPGWPSP